MGGRDVRGTSKAGHSKTLSAAKKLLQVNSNQKGGGGAALFRKHTQRVKQALAGLPASWELRHAQELMEKMEKSAVMKTPGSWRPYVLKVVHCFESTPFEGMPCALAVAAPNTDSTSPGQGNLGLHMGEELFRQFHRHKLPLTKAQVVEAAGKLGLESMDQLRMLHGSRHVLSEAKLSPIACLAFDKLLDSMFAAEQSMFEARGSLEDQGSLSISDVADRACEDCRSCGDDVSAEDAVSISAGSQISTSSLSTEKRASVSDSISLVRCNEQPRCFLRDSYLHDAADPLVWTPAHKLQPFSRVCAINGESVMVTQVHLHPPQQRTLVELQTAEARLCVTDSHPIIKVVGAEQTQLTMQAGLLQAGDYVLIADQRHRAPVVAVLLHARHVQAEVEAVELRFQPDLPVEANQFTAPPQLILSKGARQ